jgi:hypothetical protein
MKPGERTRNGNENAYDLTTMPDQQFSNDFDSQRSSEDAQAGVKRIEAVSKAWTFTSLTIAYVTYGVSPHIG